MFNWFAQLKVYFARSGMYIGIINFLMILATFKITYNIPVSAYIIVPVGFVFALGVGYADYKLVMTHEVKHNNKKNDIKQQLNEIQKQLLKLENK